MHPVSLVLSILLILVLFASSAMDFQRNPQIMAMIERFGLPKGTQILLGLLKVAGALGLLAGLVRGHSHGHIVIATAVCIAVYFFIAMLFHLRAKDKLKDIAPAFILFLLAFVLAIHK